MTDKDFLFGITKYVGTERDVVVPEVSVIYRRAFAACDITSVVIPSSVKKIESEAFLGCKSLRRVRVEGADTVIDAGAFFDCEALREVEVPEGFPYVVRFAVNDALRFYNFANLPETVKPEQVVRWVTAGAPRSAPPEVSRYFKEHYLDILETVVKQRDAEALSALLEMPHLGRTRVAVLDDLLALSDDPLTSAVLLEYKKRHYTQRELEEYDSDMLSKQLGEKAFALEDYETLFTVKEEKGGYVLSRYRGKEPSLVIADSLSGKPVVGIASETFQSCDTLMQVVLPDTLRSLGDRAFGWCKNLSTVIFGKGLREIGWSAFAHCVSLESVTLPDGVRTIGNGAFDGCENLRYASLGKGLKRAGSSLFHQCKNLISADLGSSVERMGEALFADCASLSSVVFPDSLRVLDGEYVGRTFSGCTALTSVAFGKGIERLPRNLFENTPALKSVCYAGDVAGWCAIGFLSAPLAGVESFVVGGKKLVDLVIPEGVATIPQNAFLGYRGLRSLILSAGVAEVEEFAFAGCLGLRTVTYLGTVKEWEKVKKGDRWCENSEVKRVLCLDGEVPVRKNNL